MPGVTESERPPGMVVEPHTDVRRFSRQRRRSTAKPMDPGFRRDDERGVDPGLRRDDERVSGFRLSSNETESDETEVSAFRLAPD